MKEGFRRRYQAALQILYTLREAVLMFLQSGALVIYLPLGFMSQVLPPQNHHSGDRASSTRNSERHSQTMKLSLAKNLFWPLSCYFSPEEPRTLMAPPRLLLGGPSDTGFLQAGRVGSVGSPSPPNLRSGTAVSIHHQEWKRKVNSRQVLLWTVWNFL